ncbi:hypothetical protein Bhyg_05641 [Pseudolycoriella hygida]|uniref:Tetraspanin n=1 Tax=Pseudolycoriella hygida TaxID=35572 RepID=A0A9Q0S174_9DIPT|nr:hypothetical protein Bhyg_05641 [Pseudolycoriella hygida]
MDHSYRRLPADVKNWNCARISLLLINILNLAISLTAIIIGVLSQFYVFVNASFLTRFGFSYNQYAHFLYIYGIIMLPISLIGIIVAIRHSYSLTRFYTLLLSSVTIVEAVAVIVAVILYPFMERHFWSILDYTKENCDVYSGARDAMEYVQMVFNCCGLNRPNSMANDTDIETNCYSTDKYTISNYYCQPDRYYRINCYDQVYKDIHQKLLAILIYLVFSIASQGITVYFSVVHRLNIQKQRDIAIELATIEDELVISRYNRKFNL